MANVTCAAMVRLIVHSRVKRTITADVTFAIAGTASRLLQYKHLNVERLLLGAGNMQQT